MIDTAITCKVCGRPIVQIGGGHRKKEYCDEACRQMGYRRREEQKAKDAAQAAMQARWGDYRPETQQVLEDVLHLYGSEIASRLAFTISVEIAFAKDAAQAQATSLALQVRELEKRLRAIQNVEERFRNDTQVRSFVTWMEKNARYYAESSFGQRFLDGITSKRLPRRASRAEYEVILYDQLGYSQEEIRTFHEAWKAMLVDKS